MVWITDLRIWVESGGVISGEGYTTIRALEIQKFNLGFAIRIKHGSMYGAEILGSSTATGEIQSIPIFQFISKLLREKFSCTMFDALHRVYIRSTLTLIPSPRKSQQVPDT